MTPPGRGPRRADVRDWRARRWDAVVVGSGIAGLVTAIRLGQAGRRVLVVEEAEAARQGPALREPFLLAGAHDGGALDALGRELALPLIDRRRIARQPLALQVVGPEWRVDVGDPALSAGEWVAWGLAKPDDARRWIAECLEAGEAFRAAALDAPWVRSGRGLGRAFSRSGAPEPTAASGVPEALRGDRSGLGGVLAAWLRALSHGAAEPGSAAAARLVSACLAGGAGFEDAPPWLHGMLRRRVGSLLGEFRNLGRAFRLVTADGLPGIAIPDSNELWLGRALVLAAPASALGRVHEPEDRPAFLEPVPARRRHRIWLRVRRSALPEAMGPRVVVVGDPTAPLEGANHLSVAVHRDPDAPEWCDVVVRAVVDADADPGDVEREAIERVVALWPFTRLHRGDPERAGRGRDDADVIPRRAPRPRWDDDDWLEPEEAAGHEAEIELRVSARPPVYRLRRAGLAELGLEGDLLLGWRAGDAIAAELA